MAVVFLALGVLSLFTVLMIYGALVHGFVLMKLWGWFIVPAFGLPPLSIPVAIGLGMVIHFLTHQYQSTSKDDDQIVPLIVALIAPWLTLLFGWIVSLFMG